MTIDLSTSKELQLHLDPVASEDRFPSIAFDIEAKLTMPFQQTTISIKECWFSHADLNRFEDELGTLCHQEYGSAILRNMDEAQIVAVDRNNDRITIRVQAADTAGIGKVVLEVTGYPSEIATMLEKVRGYPKWW
ncbi:MAG TPA: hypothetical protein VFW53_05490 [Gallionella sp.]|nr:hypothetical protein [Gallionella sp.]